MSSRVEDDQMIPLIDVGVLILKYQKGKDIL